MTYLEHERRVWEKERKARRLWVLSLALFGGFLASNAAWVCWLLFFTASSRLC